MLVNISLKGIAYIIHIKDDDMRDISRLRQTKEDVGRVGKRGRRGDREREVCTMPQNNCE